MLGLTDAMDGGLHYCSSCSPPLSHPRVTLLASSPPLHPDFIPHFPFHAPFIGVVSSLRRFLSVCIPIATCPGGL